MTKHLIIAATLLLGGCASNSGVIQMDRNGFMLSREAPSGFHSLPPLKADALREAGEYCRSQNKIVSVTETNEAKASGPGQYPKVEVFFSCN